MTAPAKHGARQVTLDEALASKRRDRGIARAVEGADLLDPEWKDRMLGAIERCARAMPEFICDDVWTFASEQDRNFAKPKALGGVFLRAAREGWIAKTDRVKLTNNAARHRSPVPVWASRIHRGRAA